MSSSFILFGAALLSLTLFSGCAQKKSTTLACLKGNSTCYSQQAATLEDNCPSCHVVL